MTYLFDNVLTKDQRDTFVDWLATRASESNALGRVFFAQLGGNILE
ncbi:hypothetical protein [Noviherbaspirillum saxi]|nr:hypothetical protein [Noviherbaspirillum saxi]